VTLLGQTVNSYNDGAHDFADLLRAVGRSRGRAAAAVHVALPTDFTDGVVAAMAGDRCGVRARATPGAERLGAPLLKRMLRRYDRARYLEVVARAARRRPGHYPHHRHHRGIPGETEQDFQETLSLVEQVGFDDALHLQVLAARGDARDPAQGCCARRRVG